MLNTEGFINTINKYLRKLMSKGLIACNATSNFDPGKKYSIILPE